MLFEHVENVAHTAPHSHSLLYHSAQCHSDLPVTAVISDLKSLDIVLFRAHFHLSSPLAVSNMRVAKRPLIIEE